MNKFKLSMTSLDAPIRVLVGVGMSLTILGE